MLDEHPFGYRSNRLRSEGVLQDGDVAIGHVGRISPEKGVVQLVEAFKRVVAEFPSSRLIIAGDGPDIGRARRAAAAPGLPARVAFLGYREDIEAVYGALDLFVLNSATEGLPNAILEAMAFGVPVVATAVGGTPELVRDMETGLLIPPSDPAALATAIGSVLRDRVAAAERVRRARELVEREFDMVRLSHSVNETYRRVLTARRRA
jgi:glycosyltransferase involved in cell wall biosynthesis